MAGNRESILKLYIFVITILMVSTRQVNRSLLKFQMIGIKYSSLLIHSEQLVGDVPESGLEALWLAMHAGCEKHELYRRIITLFTNAPAHPLEDYDKLVLAGKHHNCCAPVNYPEQIPHCLGDLYKEWETWNQDGRGWLFLVTSSVYPWVDMEIECEHVIRVESADYDYNSEIGYPYQNVFDTLIEGYWCAIFGS